MVIDKAGHLVPFLMGSEILDGYLSGRQIRVKVMRAVRRCHLKLIKRVGPLFLSSLTVLDHIHVQVPVHIQVLIFPVKARGEVTDSKDTGDCKKKHDGIDHKPRQHQYDDSEDHQNLSDSVERRLFLFHHDLFV